MNKPGTWAKLSIILVVGFIGLTAALLLFLQSKPPKEERVIENFKVHRSAYEHLRAMLSADQQLLRVAAWGVETASPEGIRHPPEGLPLGRFHEYLSLLNEVGAKSASRSREHPKDACILVWAAGWAGDTRHVEICWLEREPTNLVASLNAFYQTPKPRRPVFRHIDDNWYLWADW